LSRRINYGTSGILLLLVVFTISTVAIADQPESLPIASFFPHEIYLDEQTSNFTVSVNIENLLASHRFTGVEFRLEYNKSVLSLAEIIEGEFPKDFEKFVLFIIEQGIPIISILLLPPYTRFPVGNGSIIAFRFITSGLVENSTMHLGIRFANDITPPQDDYCHIRRIWNKADLNCDGKVNVVDFVVFAKAFGTYPGQYRWNTNVDLDRNGVVDIRDAVKTAMNFGKTWEYPTSVTGMNDGLELQMTIERVHIGIGDSVNITLTLKNVGNETLMIWFGSSQSFDLYLYYMGVPVARWSDGMVFLAIVRELHLEPGETYTGTPNWKFYLYEPPIPGNYELVGVCVGYFLETSPAVVTSRLPIELS